MGNYWYFMNRNRIVSIVQAVLAALLFGASAPLAKLLLGEIEPVTLAALLYLGSGIGLLLLKAAQNLASRARQTEAEIKPGDYGWLFGAVFAGGIAAPIVLLFALKATPAATASLLLSFEGVATALIAVAIFKEAISRKAMLAIAAITIASMLLSVDFNGQWGISLGALGILGACVLWGLDNNFTRNISAKNPLTIVTIKGLGAGGFSLILALLLGSRLPNIPILLGAMALGCFSYGASIVLFIRAMRHLGAARTSALFSTAPLAGMILSFLLFREPPNNLFIAAVPLMAVGAILLINEEHGHEHWHAIARHEHNHSHDDAHHDHGHASDAPVPLEHSHLHDHSAMKHDHEHLPDTHHRHGHIGATPGS